jgi:thiamine-phosphate pyrophosphorylase
MESRSRAEGRVTQTAAPRQRLYLVTPRVENPSSFAREVDLALAAGDVAAVLLRLADGDGDERTQIEHAKTITAAAQRRDVAVLIDGHAGIAARAGADGAHISGIEAFVAALPLLKPDRIAGAGGLHSRHDAMLAAESGADYVMFGEPDHRGRRLPFDDLEERLQWWAELFEIPCVGYADHPDEVTALARTGADFVALGEWIWTEQKGVAAAIAAAAENLAAPVPR